MSTKNSSPSDNNNTTYTRKTFKVKNPFFLEISTRLEGPQVPAVPDRKEL